MIVLSHITRLSTSVVTRALGLATSSATMAVTILVRLAGGTSWCSLRPYRTAPDASSMTTATSALMRGGATSRASTGAGRVGVAVGAGARNGGATWSGGTASATGDSASGAALLAGAGAAAWAGAATSGRRGGAGSLGAQFKVAPNAAASASPSAANARRLGMGEGELGRFTFTTASTPPSAATLTTPPSGDSLAARTARAQGEL